MGKSKQAKDVSVYQIKVTLKDIKPPIWRSFQVTSDTSLRRLHLILQIVMGWGNCHLHEFAIGNRRYGDPDPEYDGEDDRKTKLSQIVKNEKEKFIYEYDFGDSWVHEILIEKILPPEPGIQYPVCLKGKRACPPEDSGGVWGYADLLEIMKDPDNEEYEDTVEWLGGELDPEAFDLDSINQELRDLGKVIRIDR